MPARIDDAPIADEPQRSVAAPLFWACLLFSVALYAPCVLAGRVVAWADLQQQYDRNQAELIGVQRQVRHLQRVADALEADPGFAAQLARVELGAAPAGARVIALPPELANDPRVPPPVEAIEPPRAPWYLSIMQRLAGDSALRRNLLLAAAGVFLFGFLVFRDGAFAAPRGLLRVVFGRYLRKETECEGMKVRK
jgi:hypothetical protein